MKRLLMLPLLLCAAVFVSHAQPELKKNQRQHRTYRFQRPAYAAHWR